jgi:hypothetical protein
LIKMPRPLYREKMVSRSGAEIITHLYAKE